MQVVCGLCSEYYYVIKCSIEIIVGIIYSFSISVSIYRGIPIEDSKPTMAYQKDAKTHQKLRSLVCLMCFQKLKTMRPITGDAHKPKEKSLLEKIQTYFIEGFDPANPKFPAAVCSHCYNLLIRTPDNLPDPIDFTELEFPSRAQIRELKLSSLDEMVGCTCSLCMIGRQSGNQFSPQASPAYKKGRPAILPPKLAVRKPIRICGRCERVLGKGIPHPQNCSITDLRDNRQEKLEKDPIGYERSASKLIKKKIGESSSGDTAIKLVNTAGKPLVIPKPNTRSVSRALFTDQPVSQEAFGKMSSQAHLTANQQRVVAQHQRVWHGRGVLEPNLRLKQSAESKSLKEFFQLITLKLDHSDKKVRDIGELVDRKVFITSDMKSLVENLCEYRGYEMKDTYLKLMADAGKKTMKICFTLQKLVLEGTTPPGSSRSTYQDGGSKDKFKDSGVNRLQIIVNTEQIEESYFNLKKLYDLIKPYNFRAHHRLFTKAFDMKLNLVWHGLGTASSTYPCLYCLKKKINFADELTMLDGGELRTYGHIKENAEKYRLAKEKHTLKQKLSSAEWFNCEFPPIDQDQFPDETLLLEVCPIMNLHNLLGLFNDVFDILDRILELFELPIRGEDWTKSVGINREKSHGGKPEFNGRQCHMMLSDNSWEKLLKLLNAHSGVDAMSRVVNALDVIHSLKQMVYSCFGHVRLDRYKTDIKRYASHYIKLINYCQQINRPKPKDIILHVTVKAHVVFAHIVKFFEIMDAKGLAKFGLGLYSEQSGETVHKDFDLHYWVGKSYKRSMDHPDYDKNWFDCNLAYDSDHKGYSAKKE